MSPISIRPCANWRTFPRGHLSLPALVLDSYWIRVHGPLGPRLRHSAQPLNDVVVRNGTAIFGSCGAGFAPVHPGAAMGSTCSRCTPELVYDLPSGGKRIIQRSTGCRLTFVAGTGVSADGEFAGARPGRLVRGAQAGPALH